MKYTIKKGDTLSEISEALTGRWRNYAKIAELNGISNPDYIRAGDTIEIPDELLKEGSGSNTKQATTAVENQTAAPKKEVKTNTPEQQRAPSAKEVSESLKTRKSIVDELPVDSKDVKKSKPFYESYPSPLVYDYNHKREQWLDDMYANSVDNKNLADNKDVKKSNTDSDFVEPRHSDVFFDSYGSPHVYDYEKAEWVYLMPKNVREDREGADRKYYPHWLNKQKGLSVQQWEMNRHIAAKYMRGLKRDLYQTRKKNADELEQKKQQVINAFKSYNR